MTMDEQKLAELCIEPAQWAHAFKQAAHTQLNLDLDEAWLTTWFTNAIGVAYAAVRRDLQARADRLPDTRPLAGPLNPVPPPSPQPDAAVPPGDRPPVARQHSSTRAHSGVQRGGKKHTRRRGHHRAGLPARLS